MNLNTRRSAQVYASVNIASEPRDGETRLPRAPRDSETNEGTAPAERGGSRGEVLARPYPARDGRRSNP